MLEPGTYLPANFVVHGNKHTYLTPSKFLRDPPTSWVRTRHQIPYNSSGNLLPVRHSFFVIVFLLLFVSFLRLLFYLPILTIVTISLLPLWQCGGSSGFLSFIRAALYLSPMISLRCSQLRAFTGTPPCNVHSLVPGYAPKYIQIPHFRLRRPYSLPLVSLLLPDKHEHKKPSPLTHLNGHQCQISYVQFSPDRGDQGLLWPAN